MFLHGQLSPAGRLSMAAHIAWCPQCRRRKEELERATSVLASAVRGAAMPAWRPHFTFWFGRESIVVGGAILAIGLMLLSFWINIGFTPPAPTVGSRQTTMPKVMVSGTSIGAECKVPQK